MADGDKVFIFFFIEIDMDMRQRFQTASESIAKFSGTFGNSSYYPSVSGKKDSDFILVSYIKCAEDNGFSLVFWHRSDLCEVLQKKSP